MDAVEFFKEAKRYCKWCKNTTQDGKKRLCEVCYFEKLNDIFNLHPMGYHKFVETVEQWAKEHPVKTRQSEFLKIFPSAEIEDEIVSICPAKLNVAPHATNMGRTCIYVHDCAECRKCKRDFWLNEISEREADKNAPEAITRCLDCRYSSRDKETNQTWCNYSTERMETSMNWYCHHGKRREG